MRRTFLAIFLVAIIRLCIPGSAFGQGDLFGQNLYLFSVPPHTDFPDLYFIHNGWSSHFRFQNGYLDYYTDSGDRPIRVDRDAAEGLFNLSKSGMRIGNGAGGGALSIYRSQSYDFPNAKSSPRTPVRR